MTYLVLARRTRPQSLSELVGQNSIRDALKGMLESNKIPHAFLFTGIRGTGKTSTARILAKSLNCEKGPLVEPCQTCRHCTQISACAHEDVFEIDGASHTGVDNIRELRESARFFPVSARYKIFIIDEVHMLSTGAFNALLKTLEEPPAQVVFVLATTELHKIPVTIRSRCLIFSFKKIAVQEVCQQLASILKAEKVDFEEDALKLIAREGQGSLRDALSFLEQVLALQTSNILTALQTKQSLGLHNDEIALNIFNSICEKNQAAALETLQKSDETGLDLSLIIEGVANYFRYALLLKASSKLYQHSLLQEEVQIIEQKSKALDTTTISEVFKTLSLAVKDIQRSIHPLSWAEIVVIDAISRTEWISASEMLLKIEGSTTSGVNSKVKSNLQPDEQYSETSKNNVEHKETKGSQSTFQHTLESKTVDLALYQKFVSTAKKYSPTLGARLSFVKLEEFTQNQVRFADTPENKTYLAFDAKDRDFFWRSLEDIGIKPDALQNKSMKEASISLHQIQEEEKKKSYALKEKEILSRESVKNLMVLSKEIKLTPIEN